MLAASVGPRATAADRKSPAGTPATCVSFTRSFDDAEKELAAIAADELADSSAVRGALRNQRTQIEQNNAAAALAGLRANRCKLPTHAASQYSYLSAALDCRVAIAKGQADGPACRRAYWTRGQQAK